MDRHGNKEIKSMAAVLGCVMAGILLLSSVYLVYRYEERNRQAAQLALRYPWSEGVWIEIREAKNTADTKQADREKQKELQEKYGYYFFSAKESKEILLLFASEILIIAGIFAGAVFFIRKRAKTEENLERAQISRKRTGIIFVLLKISGQKYRYTERFWKNWNRQAMKHINLKAGIRKP